MKMRGVTGGDATAVYLPAVMGAKGEKLPVPQNRVFLAFVNTERIVYNWRWEPTDDDRRDLPIGYRDRFRRNLL
jgi:hypothetical protein